MAASLKVPKQFRSWKTCDSYDNSDVARLFDAENVRATKPANCARYWSLYVTLVGFSALFFVCILVGFYLRDDENASKFCSGEGRRGDGLESDRLQAVHNNIVYHTSGDRIIQYVRELTSLRNSVSFLDFDGAAAMVVRREFQQFGFDHVDVEEREIQVKSPDQAQPNRLTVLQPDGSASFDVSIVRRHNSSQSQPEWPPFVAFSQSAVVQGLLVYGGSGRYVDFLILQVQGVNLRGAIVLLHLDETPVSEKVRLAERFGCAGVLLFCPPDNISCFHDNKNAPFSSAADFTDPAYVPSIPVQTLSTATGARLLQMSNIQATSDQEIQWAPTGTNLTVRLTVNNSRQHTIKVYNVIGTILGDLEPDRHILTGAVRQTWPDSGVDAVSSTAMLLEMARSFLHIQQMAGWRPRRTLKFVSWGGNHLSQAGLLHHFTTQKQLLEKEAVTYLEVNPGVIGSDVIKIEASPALISLAKIAKAMVPNPANPDISLDVFSPDMSQQAVYQSERGLVMTYTASTVRYPMMLQLGIPMVNVGVKATNISKRAKQEYSRDINHHYKYHVSQCRVAARMMLSLVDSPLLPFNVHQYSEHAWQIVNQTVNFLQAHGPQCQSTGSLERLLQQLTLSSAPTSRQWTGTCEKLRKLNNRLSRLDQLFVAYLTNRNPLPVGLSANHSASNIDFLSNDRSRSEDSVTNREHASRIDSAAYKNVPTFILAEDRHAGVLQIVADTHSLFSLTHNKNMVCGVISSLSSLLDQLSQQLDQMR